MSEMWNWELFAWHVFLVFAYFVLGLALFGLAFLLIEKFTPFSLSKEILEHKNNALGIILGAVFLGIAIILAAAIRG